jgi:hypothetical protein
MRRSRAGLVLVALLSVCACSGNEADTVKITLFQATPDIVELGQSTKLVFVVEPSDAQLSITGVGDMTSRTQAIVRPTTTTTYHLMATKGVVTEDVAVTVTVTARKTVGFKLTAASTTTAGQSLSVTVTAIDAAGGPARGFHGTVHLTSSDPAAVLPADIVFPADDGGVEQTTVTLKTAGLVTLTATDTANAGTRGTTTVTVQAATAASCAVSRAPASSVAGATVVITVTAHDVFGNVAVGYAGTVRLTSSDARAILPPDTTFVPAADAGSLAFAAALLTTGNQSLSATDLANGAIQCSASISVTPAAPKLVLSVPSDANAGYAVAVGVTVNDLFDNAIPNYAGTVTFTSTDTGTGAVTPAPLTFNGSEGGVGSTGATFVSIGTQTLSATDGGNPAASGSGASAVHGLVYTMPTAGRVRLVANAAQSNTQVVQLDLVANERLEVSTLVGGPGSFAAGMNLPLDTTRVGADAALFTPGAALPAGTGTRAAAGTIGATDHVLYTVVARKRTTSTILTQDTDVAAGQVFYSVRLKLSPTATPGAVFDGAQPSPLYRAAVRDQFGNDFVGQNEFGIGRLEVR